MTSSTDGPAPAGRLDAHLVRTGAARSRGHARELIDAGAVHVDGRVVTRASTRVTADADVQVGSADLPSGQAPDGTTWVGRGAYKLLAALEEFGPGGLSVRGRRCLDVGASTGGFTQVLLTRGAERVVALDVGHGQLVPEIAGDPRVDERSRVNVRDVTPDDLPGPFDLVVGDLSFISLTLVLPALVPLLADGADVVLLVKPQFEVGRGGLDKKGVVRSARSRADAVATVVGCARGLGLHPKGLCRSPISGGAGNVEYLVWFVPSAADALTDDDIRARLGAWEGQAR